MMVLDNLKSLGYEVQVEENGIKLSYKGKGTPDESRVVPLLEELKANKDKAIKKLKHVRKAYKIYSKILEDYLWIAVTDKELQELVEEGIKETIYTQEEVSRMIDEGVSKEGLKAIHRVKNFFPVSSVENISDVNTGKKLIPLSDETLRDIFLKVMHKISDSYIQGTLTYIKKHNKELDDGINKADGRINEIWKECNQGKASLDDFKDSLASYEKIYSAAIEIYKKVKQ